MDISQMIFSPWQRQAELQGTQQQNLMRQMELQAFPQKQQMEMEKARANISHLNALAQMQQMTTQKMQSEMGLEQDVAQAVAQARQAPSTGMPEGAAPISPAMQQANAFRTAGDTLLSKGKVNAAGLAFKRADEFSKTEDARASAALAQKAQFLTNYQKETELANDAFSGVDSQESLDRANMQFQQMTGRSSPFAGKTYDPKLIPMYFQNRNMVHGKGVTQYQQEMIDFRREQETRRAGDAEANRAIRERLVELKEQLIDIKSKAGDKEKESATEQRMNKVLAQDVGTGYFRLNEMFKRTKSGEIPSGSPLLLDERKIDGVIGAAISAFEKGAMPTGLQSNDASLLGVAFDLASARAGGGRVTIQAVKELLRQMPIITDAQETKKEKMRYVFNALDEANQNLPSFRKKDPEKYFGSDRLKQVHSTIGYGPSEIKSESKQTETTTKASDQMSFSGKDGKTYKKPTGMSDSDWEEWKTKYGAK